MKNPVNHPEHYTSHPSGVECIQITEHMNFNLGNALKYIWRADLKYDAIEDMRKAIFYLEREITKRDREGYQEPPVRTILEDDEPAQEYIPREDMVELVEASRGSKGRRS